MVWGPMPEDRTNVGGESSSFNTTDASNSDPQPPIEQHSPTQVHVPAWKTIVIGGSGGIAVRGYYRD